MGRGDHCWLFFLSQLPDNYWAAGTEAYHVPRGFAGTALSHPSFPPSPSIIITPLNQNGNNKKKKSEVMNATTWWCGPDKAVVAYLPVRRRFFDIAFTIELRDVSEPRC